MFNNSIFKKIGIIQNFVCKQKKNLKIWDKNCGDETLFSRLFHVLYTA